MQALFTGGLGDFIGAESFMTDEEKDSVTTVLWATRNSEEIKSAIDIKTVFPNIKQDKELYTDWATTRPTRPWQPGDPFMNIGTKVELNTKCKLNLSDAELSLISDHSLDATLSGIFSGARTWQNSRVVNNMQRVDISKFNLPDRYVVIHPWSDAEINGREFNDADWDHILAWLTGQKLIGVVVNKSNRIAPLNAALLDLTNLTDIKETFTIIARASACIMCASSLACYATKIFPRGKIWIKGGFDHMFTEWATWFYHGPFKSPSSVIFRDLSVLNPPMQPVFTTREGVNLDKGFLTLI